MKVATNPPPGAPDFEFWGAESGGEFPGDDNAVVVDVLAGATSDRLFHIDVHDAGAGTGNHTAISMNHSTLGN